MVTVSHRPPMFQPEDAVAIAQELYGLAVVAQPLPGEYDLHFHLTTATGAAYVLRIAHAGEDAELLEMQYAVLEHLAEHAPQLLLQRVVPTVTDARISQVIGQDGTEHLVRLMSYLPGRLLAHSRPHSPTLLAKLGWTLGELDRMLLNFDHPAASRSLKWDQPQALWCRSYIDAIADPQQHTLVSGILDQFEQSVLPKLAICARALFIMTPMIIMCWWLGMAPMTYV